MANSERIAAAAHLHVALRRKAGRVTDTDWMAVNDVYAQAMVRLAHEKAQELHDPSLAELASRLSPPPRQRRWCSAGAKGCGGQHGAGGRAAALCRRLALG